MDWITVSKRHTRYSYDLHVHCSYMIVFLPVCRCFKDSIAACATKNCL